MVYGFKKRLVPMSSVLQARGPPLMLVAPSLEACVAAFRSDQSVAIIHNSLVLIPCNFNVRITVRWIMNI